MSFSSPAVAWGSGAAVVMRIVLTIVAVELLRLPFLKLVGAALLLWIAVQLLLPEDEGGDGHTAGSASLMSAIKTILLADLVMSLDNVIAVAAAAKGSTALLILGLGISIPLVVFASTLLLTLMGRFPIIITIGAALLGWVAGEMAISDPAVKSWIDANAAFLHYLAPGLGAVGVVLFGTLLARRAEARQAAALPVAASAHVAKGFKRVLLAVDGSEGAEHAVRHLLTMRDELRDPAGVDLHLVNVQRCRVGFRTRGARRRRPAIPGAPARRRPRHDDRRAGQFAGRRPDRDGSARPGNAYRGAARLGGAAHGRERHGAGAAGQVALHGRNPLSTASQRSSAAKTSRVPSSSARAASVGTRRLPCNWNSGTSSASPSLRKWPETVGCATHKASSAPRTLPRRTTASKAASCGSMPWRR